MSAALILRPTPEARELPYRRHELAALRAELATQEAHLTALRNQLHTFEARYIRQVAVLYIQLDNWNDRIAELNNPTPPAPCPTAAAPASPPPTASPEPSLKALFRQLVRRIHPDHARDAHDEHHRTQLMTQANTAFLRGDAALLQRMIHSHDLPIVSTDARNELGQTLALIRHLQNDIAAITAEFEALTHSEMADLHRRTRLAAGRGQDLLAELAAQVKGSIGLAMRRYELDLARRRRRQPAFDPAPLLSAESPDPR